MENSFEFSQYQKDIFKFVESDSQNGIINAVAGSGKTTTILQCKPIPGDTLFCAFNRDVRSEIKNKLSKEGRKDINVSTIHRLGYSMLKREGEIINVNTQKTKELFYHLRKEHKEFRDHFSELYSQMRKNRSGDVAFETISKRVQDIYDLSRLTLTPITAKALYDMMDHYSKISQGEKRLPGPNTLLKEFNLILPLIEIMKEEGIAMYRKDMSVDFNDLLFLPICLGLSPKSTYDLVFVDECQDLNKAQIELVKMHLRDRTGRLIAVGDPCQAIYGFAGADSKSFYNVKSSFVCKDLPLSTSFRCPYPVIRIAKAFNSEIEGNGGEGNVSFVLTDSIAELAREGDFVLSRYKKDLLLLLFDCVRLNKKVYISEDLLFGEEDIFREEERTNTISKSDLCCLIDKKASDLTLNETYRPLFSFLKENLPTGDSSTSILQVLESSNISTKSPGPDHINFFTIHRAKGLEAERVFIINFSDLPIETSSMQDWEKQQERNLTYVAVTRARKELFLGCYSEDDIRDCEEKYFNNDMPLTTPCNNKNRIVTPAHERLPINKSIEIHIPERELHHSKAKDYKKGDEVFHKSFHKGVVLDVYGNTLVIQFQESIKRINPEIAKMKRLPH